MSDIKCVYDLKPLNWVNWLCSRRLKTQRCYRKAGVINYVTCCKEMHMKQKGDSQARNGSVCQERWERRESRHFSWEVQLRREGGEKLGSNPAVDQEDTPSSTTLEDEEGPGCRAKVHGWLVSGGEQKRQVQRQVTFYILLTLLLLSCFSRVWFYVTLWTVACQAPLSMGFSKQASTKVGCHALPPRGSSPPRDSTQVSCIAGRFFTTGPPGKPLLTLFSP